MQEVGGELARYDQRTDFLADAFSPDGRTPGLFRIAEHRAVLAVPPQVVDMRVRYLRIPDDSDACSDIACLEQLDRMQC
ncbi:hypothetical protein RugamoR64_12930 [Duganella rhizosphaerae]